MKLLLQEAKSILDGTSEAGKENANKDSRLLGTKRELLFSTLAKELALDMFPNHIKLAHKTGHIHIHDLAESALGMTNCCLVNLEDMLKNGTVIGGVEIKSPKSIAVACAIIPQIIAHVSASQYGGQSYHCIDEVLSPYIEKSYNWHLLDAKKYKIKDAEKYAEERTEADCKRAFKALEYEINSLFTANAQTPFVTFSFGLGTDKFSRMAQKHILKTRIKGFGKSQKTAVFPKLCYIIKSGVNRCYSDPNYDIKKLAVECSAKRFYPDYLNYDKLREVRKTFVTPMGCRSFLHPYYNEDGKEIKNGRFNLGVITVNLPLLALEAMQHKEKNLELFAVYLRNTLELVKEAHLCRIKNMEHLKAECAPILYMHGGYARLNADEEIGQLFKHGYASVSIGYIGLYEMCRILFGVDYTENDDIKEFAVKTLEYMTEKCNDFTIETGYSFSVYSTPAESLCETFVKKMNNLNLGDVEVLKNDDDICGKGYLVNSFHVTYKKMDFVKRMEFEKEFPKFTKGGFISYVELPKVDKQLDLLESIIDYSYDKIPYFGINPPVDECFECGYIGDFKMNDKGLWVCLCCGNDEQEKMSVIKRVSGYLYDGSARKANNGKLRDIITRRANKNL